MSRTKEEEKIPYSTDSCPSCVKKAMETELKAMGKKASAGEELEIKSWERKHGYLKAVAFIVLLLLIWVLYSVRPA